MIETCPESSRPGQTPPTEEPFSPLMGVLHVFSRWGTYFASSSCFECRRCFEFGLARARGEPRADIIGSDIVRNHVHELQLTHQIGDTGAGCATDESG